MARRVVNYKALQQTWGPYVKITIPREENGGKEVFAKGDEVIVAIYTSDPLESVLSSMGAIQPNGSDLVTVNQYIPVIMTKYAMLDYVPAANYSYRWLGSDFGNVSRSHRKLTFEGDDFLGFLHVSYQVERKLYLLRDLNKSNVRVLIHAVNSEHAYDTSYIDVVGNTGGILYAYLVVRDFHTGLKVPGTKVKTGIFGGVLQNKGQTDDDGRIYLGELEHTTYGLELDPPSPYLHSSEDGISNDRFTI